MVVERLEAPFAFSDLAIRARATDVHFYCQTVLLVLHYKLHWYWLRQMVDNDLVDDLVEALKLKAPVRFTQEKKRFCLTLTHPSP